MTTKTRTSAERLAEEFQSLVEQTASSLLGRKLMLGYTYRDQLRLMNLKVWTVRYRVDLSELLPLLFKFYGTHKRTYRTNRRSLPVPVSMLCSVRSRDFLEEWVVKNNPESENEIAAAGLAASIASLVATQFQTDWVQDYAASVRSQRNHVDAVRSNLKNRQFRGNPFRILG